MTDISSSFHQDQQGVEIQGEEKEKEEKARCEWDFHLSTVISSCNSISGSGCDTLGVLEFDPCGNFLATGGIARKIRIYGVNSLLQEERESERRTTGAPIALDHGNACNYYICTPAKLGCLKWKPGWGSRVLGSGDYDGVVMEYDLEKKMPIFERDEHGGRRVWSIDYCHSDPVLGASGSDDGTMQMWDPRCGDNGKCLAMVQPSSNQYSPVCCVEFNPFRGPIVAVGCADRRVYAYDMRKMLEPIFVLDGHQKTVTYIRFLDERTIISSSIDGCLKMWDAEDQRVIRTYKGHNNSRRFVGLSVWKPGGLICCGSESNQVFVYDKRWGEPIWVYGREPMGLTRHDDGFVSSVCWQQKDENQCTLVAGDSEGDLRVFSGKRRLIIQ